ncbi:MAG: DUF7021 domain-containing protein [Pseudoclavibacter sp.]
MSEKRERKAFNRRHASEVLEIVVLTGKHTGGAEKTGRDVLWMPSADVLAYVDEAGSAVVEAAQLSWLATQEQRGSWIHDLEPLTQYVVRVRRAITDPVDQAKHGVSTPNMSHNFALDEVIERNVHEPALDEWLGRWLQPVGISTDVGDFELERSIGVFSGRVLCAGSEVTVMLAIDEDSIEGAETCRGALSRLVELVAAMPDVDARRRAFAASKLTDVANDWQHDDENLPAPEPITAEAFAQRIRLKNMTIAANGSATTYYDDDDDDDGRFRGHMILVGEAPDGTLADADIAG